MSGSVLVVFPFVTFLILIPYYSVTGTFTTTIKLLI